MNFTSKLLSSFIILALVGSGSFLHLFAAETIRTFSLRHPERATHENHSTISNSSTVATPKSPTEDVDSFIIHTLNGEATCREATHEEVRLTLPPANNPGVPVNSLLRPNSAVPSGENSSSGLTINFVALSQLQTDPNMAVVVAAFQRAAAVWTDRIKSPVTISIKIDYGPNFPGDNKPFKPSVLGSTSSRRTLIDYPGARTNLLASASFDSEFSLYSALPTSFVPTDVGNGAAVSVSRSTAFALGLPVTNPADDNVATMGFNSNFSFDFNQDDGITPGQIDFVAVAAHEIGHALGFVSNAGIDDMVEISLWDLFRFRPDVTTATFTTANRILSIGDEQVYFTGQTFFVDHFPKTALRLSTGGPDGDGGDGSQSSHWKDNVLTGEFIGIMDPTIPSGQREDPTGNDFATLETIGWNLFSNAPIPPPPPPPPPPANDNFASAQTISGCAGNVTGTNVGATAETNEPNHSPDGMGGSRSVWYQWQAPVSGNATFTTAGSGFDTILGIYTGSSVGALTLVGNSDDVVPGTERTSRVDFVAAAGTVYRIAVGGFDNFGSGGDFGSFHLNWSVAGCAAPSIQFNSSTFDIQESTASMDVVVQRTGDTSVTSTVEYITSDGSGTNKCNVASGQASSRCDYIMTLGTLTFAPGDSSKTIRVPIVDDVFTEGSENFTMTLSNVNGATLGATSIATLTITETEAGGANPIDNTDFFVRQQYIDFLNREPDQAGLNFWKKNITDCGGDAQCIEVARINVSAAFFLSIEFQETGYFAYRTYKTAFGGLPGRPVPVAFTSFLRDTQRIGEGVQVGIGDWKQKLEANKQAYMLAFVQRPEFLTAYPFTMTATVFVNTLESNAGGGLFSPAEKSNLIAMLTIPNDFSQRAAVLRVVAEHPKLRDAEFTKAFVLMQYFGYLRRNPDDSPNGNFTGWQFWLDKLNQFNGNFIQAEMVKAFITSLEYRERFGP